MCYALHVRSIHARTHALTHARTHTRTHSRTHAWSTHARTHGVRSGQWSLAAARCGSSSLQLYRILSTGESPGCSMLPDRHPGCGNMPCFLTARPSSALLLSASSSFSHLHVAQVVPRCRVVGTGLQHCLVVPCRLLVAPKGLQGHTTVQHGINRVPGGKGQ